MQRQISRHTCSELCLRGVSDSALPRLELFVRRSKLSPCFPRDEFYQFGAVNRGSYTLLFLRVEYIARPVFKHLNNKLAVYVYEAVECFGKQI